MQDDKFTIAFPAEVKEVNSKKTASLDVNYKVVLFTSDPTVLNLGALAGDTLLDVKIEVQS